MTRSPSDILALAQAYQHADQAFREARTKRERLRQQLLQILGPAMMLDLPECTIARHYGVLSVVCRPPGRRTP